MPTPLLLIIVFFVLSAATGTAFAEDLSDIKVRGLLQYEGFGHSLSLGYDFNDNKTSQSSGVSHHLEESYNASLQFALIDPRILDASIQGSVIFDQNWNQSDASSSNMQTNTYTYNFTGSGLNKSRIPFTLLSFRNINTVQNTFSTPTTTDNNGNEFGITFLNDKLQSHFQFARNSSNTSLSGASSSSLSNSYSYSAIHRTGSFSVTTLSAAFSDQSGSTGSDTLNSSTNSLALANSLVLGANNNYTLASSFQLNNTITDNTPQRTLSFSEAFGATLGRALSLTATYSLSNSTSSNLTGDAQKNTMNQGAINLRHKLFESLETDLQGIASLNKQNDGTDNKYEIRGNTTYRKKLSEGNSFSLGVSKGYSLTDRRVASDTTTIRDELHAAAHQGDVIELLLADGTLRSVSAVTGRNPVFTYIEGIDYTVNLILGRITILSGGGVRIDPNGSGSDLYVTYTVYKDPQVSYSSDTLSLTTDLGLFKSQLNLGASWSESKQTQLSGTSANGLQNSQSLTLYVSGNFDTLTGRLSYRDQKTGGLSFKTVEASVTPRWQTEKSIISLVARNIYNMYDATATAKAYWDNNADMSLSYQRNILASTTLTLLGNLNDSRSQLKAAKDSLSLKVNTLTRLNMIAITLSGQTAWIIESNNTTRNDSFHLLFTRYF